MKVHNFDHDEYDAVSNDNELIEQLSIVVLLHEGHPVFSALGNCIFIMDRRRNLVMLHSNTSITNCIWTN